MACGEALLDGVIYQANLAHRLRIDAVDGSIYYRLACEGGHVAHISNVNGSVFDEVHARWD